MASQPLFNLPLIVYDAIQRMGRRISRIRERRAAPQKSGRTDERRSLVNQASLVSLGSPSADAAAAEESKLKVTNDGKTFVEALLKRQDKLAADDPQVCGARRVARPPSPRCPRAASTGLPPFSPH